MKNYTVYSKYRVYLCDHDDKLWLIVNNKPYALSKAGRLKVMVDGISYEVNHYKEIYYITIQDSEYEQVFISWLQKLPRRPNKAQYFKCVQISVKKVPETEIVGQISIFDAKGK